MNKLAQYLLLEKAAKAKGVPAGCLQPDEPIEAKKLRRAKNKKARELRQSGTLGVKTRRAAAKKRRATRLSLPK